MNILLQRCVAVALLAVLAAAWWLPAQAASPWASCSARSTPTLTPLVELYTSEGCSSCPPADRWLNATFPRGTDAASALAFHVDYWDDAGWKDRFSSHAFTERQYEVANANHATFVYTPQVVVQGKSATDWRELAPRLAALEKTPAAATITLAVTRAGDDNNGLLAIEAIAQVADPAGREGTKLYVALTRDGLTTQVGGGENKGVTLRHDHVVESLSASASIDANGHAVLVSRPAKPVDERTATVVAFVQQPATGDVLQSLSLRLPLARCQ